ncbi:hypothetical protein BAU15_09560 [Enterococcus sp. JM4C]|nr:hypothetical protein BAU15_09560 [Enterococcus sp. JM4C]
MERVYKKHEYQCRVVYGEMFASQLQQTPVTNKRVIIVTNQRYYDRFSQKLGQLFSNYSDVDWYICTNSAHCNNLDELTALLNFTAKFSQEMSYLFVAFGNEGVMKLTGFFQKVSVLSGELWCLPVSIRSLAKALTLSNTIEKANYQEVMALPGLASQVIFDQTLTNNQSEGKMVDLLWFLQCGIVRDHEFLKLLYKNYPNQKKLMRQSFNGLIESLLNYYEADSESIETYGQLFEQAFYQLSAGHLLSDHMKRLLGILLHLKWNDEIESIQFNYQNFLIWLDYLGFPIALPNDFLTSTYVEQVLLLGKKSKKIVVLEKIGIIKEHRLPTEKELLKTLESYKTIVQKIKGEQHENI